MTKRVKPNAYNLYLVCKMVEARFSITNSRIVVRVDLKHKGCTSRRYYRFSSRIDAFPWAGIPKPRRMEVDAVECFTLVSEKSFTFNKVFLRTRNQKSEIISPVHTAFDFWSVAEKCIMQETPHCHHARKHDEDHPESLAHLRQFDVGNNETGWG